MSTTTIPYKTYKDVPHITQLQAIVIDTAIAMNILQGIGLQPNNTYDNDQTAYFLGSDNTTLLRDTTELIKEISKRMHGEGIVNLHGSAGKFDWHFIPYHKGLVNVDGSVVYIVHYPGQQIRVHNKNSGSTALTVHIGAPNKEGTGYNLHGNKVVAAGSTVTI
jgi:calcineurin-like phosphoesterase family protein